MVKSVRKGCERMALSNSQLAYVKRIKEELNLALGTSKYTYTQLQGLLESRYGFKINKGTLRDLFDVNSPNMNYACLITTCKFFGFDFNEFLMPDEIEEDNEYFSLNAKYAKNKRSPGFYPLIESLASVEDKFTILRDDGYMCDYKGYIITPSDSNSIDEFDLSMYKDSDGIAHAKLVRQSKSNGRTERFEFEGIPYHSKAYQSVLIFLTDTKANGEFYFLSFGFQQYRNEEGLLFRQGLAVTGKSLRSGSMISQNFILLSQDLAEQNSVYIPGLLKSPANEFCVPVEIAHNLAKQHPEVEHLLQTLADSINHTAENIYIFNEDIILQLNRLPLSTVDRIKALLLLKGEAIIPDKNYYVANSKYSGFAKNYLLKNNS